MKRIFKILIRAGIPVLVAVLAALFVCAQAVYAIEDYRGITLFYNDTFVPIIKPTAALVISAAGMSVSDGESITVTAGAKIFLNTGGCLPGSATAVAEYDFQYYHPVLGYILGSAVPSEMTLSAPGTWEFYLCVRGNIPSYRIYGYYDDWSDNGSYSTIGEKNGEPMFWHFVKVTVNVLSNAPAPDFFIYRSGMNVTGGTINADSLPVTVDLVDNSRNASSYAWYIKTPGHADYVFFSSARNPQAGIYTAGLVNFKLRINGGYEIVKQVYVNDQKTPVAVISASSTAKTNEWFNVSGCNSYSRNSGGYIISYQWNAVSAQGTLSPWNGLGSIRYLAAGRYAIRLSVTDNFGLTSSETASYIDVTDTVPVILPPIADFSLTKAEIGIDETLGVTDNSRTSGTLETITEREWVVERAGTVIYTGNVPKTVYSETGSYAMYLRVKSSNGLWSAPADHALWTRRDFTVVFIDLLPPNVSIDPASRQWTNQNVNFTVSATDGGSAVKRLRYVISRYTDIFKDPGPYTFFNFDEAAVSGEVTAEGIWYIFAEATDVYLNVSNFKRGGPYMIDKTPPAVSAATVQGTPVTTVTVNLSASDTGGSGVNYINAGWSMLPARPLNWQRYDSASAQTSISQGGTFYLHAEVFDVAGNSKYECFGPYTVQSDSPQIESITIEGMWNYWNGLPDASGRPTANEPHRFMSLETVKINIHTSGYADRVVIRFSPELEAMAYTDGSGNVYRYKEDFFGYDIIFPADSTCLTDPASNMSHIYWEYALPLADSTKDFETGEQLRASYSMQVTVFKGAKSQTVTIGDIEITGNVLDHIFIQPR